MANSLRRPSAAGCGRENRAEIGSRAPRDGSLQKLPHTRSAEAGNQNVSRDGTGKGSAGHAAGADSSEETTQVTRCVTFSAPATETTTTRGPVEVARGCLRHPSGWCSSAERDNPMRAMLGRA